VLLDSRLTAHDKLGSFSSSDACWPRFHKSRVAELVVLRILFPCPPAPAPFPAGAFRALAPPNFLEVTLPSRVFRFPTFSSLLDAPDPLTRIRKTSPSCERICACLAFPGSLLISLLPRLATRNCCFRFMVIVVRLESAFTNIDFLHRPHVLFFFNVMKSSVFPSLSSDGYLDMGSPWCLSP